MPAASMPLPDRKMSRHGPLPRAHAPRPPADLPACSLEQCKRGPGASTPDPLSVDATASVDPSCASCPALTPSPLSPPAGQSARQIDRARPCRPPRTHANEGRLGPVAAAAWLCQRPNSAPLPKNILARGGRPQLSRCRCPPPRVFLPLRNTRPIPPRARDRCCCIERIDLRSIFVQTGHVLPSIDSITRLGCLASIDRSICRMNRSHPVSSRRCLPATATEAEKKG